MAITPRTCLWPLTVALCVSFALSMGLTYRSNTHCYAAVCSERHSPLHTRIQVVVWYLWLALTIAVLGFRSFKPVLRKFLGRQLRVPGTQTRITLSTPLMAAWIISLYGTITGIWWRELTVYYHKRDQEGETTDAAGCLVATSLTGQWCALSLGLALAPVSRHSALGSFFKLTFRDTQHFHTCISHVLVVLSIVHLLIYVYWAGYWRSLSLQQQKVFPVYNPVYLSEDVWPESNASLAKWRASLLFTGAAAAFTMIIIVATSFPLVRRRFFKVFSYIHTTSIVAVILSCLHSNSVLYCAAPGISMYILDKSMRIWELHSELPGRITPLGKGWYLLNAPLPRSRLDGCACSSPVARFYIYHTDSAVRELHPFTAITHLALEDAITEPTENSITIEFLFRRHGGETPFISVTADRKGPAGTVLRLLKRVKSNPPERDIHSRMASTGNAQEWKVRQQDSFALFDLGEGDIESVQPSLRNSKNKAQLLMDNSSVPISLRLEGPFFTPANPAFYNTVLCLVNGAGVAGALAIASAFMQLEEYEKRTFPHAGAMRRSASESYDIQALQATASAMPSTNQLERKWKRCIIIWVVCEEDYIDLPGLNSAVLGGSSLEVRTHLTGKGREELYFWDTLDRVLEEDGCAVREDGTAKTASLWCYVSGPRKFVGGAEQACKERQERGVEWTCAEIAA